MTYALRELRAATDDELIQRHDALPETTVARVNYYLEELTRPAQERATAAMLRLSRTITRLNGSLPDRPS